MRRPVVHIKTERVSTASTISRDSIQNENNMNTLNKKTSIDEGFMSTASSQTGSEKNFNDKMVKFMMMLNLVFITLFKIIGE